MEPDLIELGPNRNADVIELEPNRNAEAYRNYQPAAVPAHVDKHLDFIEFCDDGYMLLGCSNLNGRFWSGSLWYFLDADDAPNVDKCLTGIECETGVCDGKFLNDKQKIIVVEDSGVIQVFEMKEVADEHTFHFSCVGSVCEHDDSVVSLSIFKDKNRAVTGSLDSNIKVWDIESLVPEHIFRPAHMHQVTSVDARPSADNCTFASCSLDGTTLLWDTRNQKPASVVLESEGFTSVTWQPTKTDTLVVGSTWGDVTFVDVRQPKQILSELSCFKRPVHRLQFDNNRLNQLAACADDAVVKVLECNGSTPSVLYEDNRHNDFVRGLSWHPKSHTLYTCGWDKQVLSHTSLGASVKMEVNGPLE